MFPWPHNSSAVCWSAPSLIALAEARPAARRHVNVFCRTEDKPFMQFLFGIRKSTSEQTAYAVLLECRAADQ